MLRALWYFSFKSHSSYDHTGKQSLTHQRLDEVNHMCVGHEPSPRLRRIKGGGLGLTHGVPSPTHVNESQLLSLKTPLKSKANSYCDLHEP